MNFAELTGQHLEDPARRAALMLHSLADADQGWVVSQMPPAEQVQLKALMAELTQLNIPTDRRLLAQALQSAEPDTRVVQTQHATGPTAKPMSNLDFFLNLDSASERRLTIALCLEPALLVARLLRIANWTWRERILEGLPTRQRQQVDDLLANPSDMPAGVALQEALLRALRVRCEVFAPTVQIQSQPDRPQSAHSKAGAWFRYWFLRLRRLHQ